MNKNVKKIMSLAFCGAFLLSSAAYSKSAREIDAGVDTALSHFENEVPGARQLIEQSKGALVFPSVFKAGLVIGGEYGVGALFIHGSREKYYYSTVAGSVGFQLGGQSRTIIMLFMDSQVLQDFRASDGWKVGVDGSVTLIQIGAAGSVDTTKTNQPILAFVLGQKGLMYNLTLEGSKFSPIQPEA